MELATPELYRKREISLEEISRVEPRVILVPMFLLEFFYLGGFMGDVRKKIEAIVLLENQIGSLLQKREYAIRSGQIVEVDDRVLTNKEYVRLLTKDIIRYEEERLQIVDDIFVNASLDELYCIYEDVAKEPKDDDKMERLLTIFDLIERKEASRERGR